MHPGTTTTNGWLASEKQYQDTGKQTDDQTKHLSPDTRQHPLMKGLLYNPMPYSNKRKNQAVIAWTSEKRTMYPYS
jgi:hypothetical protein